MSDDNSDLTRLEDLGEFLHEEDEESSDFFKENKDDETSEDSQPVSNIDDLEDSTEKPAEASSISDESPPESLEENNDTFNEQESTEEFLLFRSR